MKRSVIAFAALGLAAPAPAAEGFQVIRPGVNPSQGAATFFTGKVSPSSPFKGTGDSRISGATVSFEVGARTHWHSHPMGQLLVVTAGAGWVQAEGEPVRLIRPGDVIWTPPGARHWHGATASSAMTHVAIVEESNGATASWFGPVDTAQYKGPE